jgi:exportin-7
VTYVFRQLTAKGKKARKAVENQGAPLQLIRLMEVRPELLQQMLSCILNIVMFEDCRNQYSMSRPLLGLILLNEDYFGQLRQSIIRSQPVDKQGLMAQWFDNLMDGIERNVTAKNRDRFALFAL